MQSAAATLQPPAAAVASLPATQAALPATRLVPGTGHTAADQPQTRLLPGLVTVATSAAALLGQLHQAGSLQLVVLNQPGVMQEVVHLQHNSPHSLEICSQLRA